MRKTKHFRRSLLLLLVTFFTYSDFLFATEYILDGSQDYKYFIGNSEPESNWKDPDFDPTMAAVYYARVIEIPTPRWTAYDAARYGIIMSEEAKMIIQERAYTSPIWYTL